MKRILSLLILIVVFQDTFSQVYPDNGTNIMKRRVFTSSASGNEDWFNYPSGNISTNNIPIPLLEYKPRDSVYASTSAAAASCDGCELNPKNQNNQILKKQPALIHLHGIGERGGSQNDRTSAEEPAPLKSKYADTSVGTGQEVDDIYTLPPTNQMRTSAGALVGRKYKSPGYRTDSVEFWIFAPQQWGQGSAANQWGFNRYPLIYARAILKKIKSDPAYYNRIDTNRIYISGQSLGGGGTYTMICDSTLNYQFAAAVPLCPGYRSTLNTGSISTASYDMIARSGLPIWIIVSENDGADLDGNGFPDGGGVIQSDAFVAAVNSRNPVCPVKLTRMVSGGHSRPWNRAYAPSNWTLAPDSMTNNADIRWSPYLPSGQPTSMTIPYKNVFEWMLQFTKENRKNQFNSKVATYPF